MTAVAGPLTMRPPVWRRLVSRVLRLPLLMKLGGANALIVVVAWTAVYVDHRGRSDDWPVLTVLAAALATGMVANVVLLVIALRPIKALEATAARVWKGDLGARVPWSAVADPGIEKLSVALNLLLESLSHDRRQARALTEQVVQQGDRQRAEVARQLHESIAQSLAGQLYLLRAARDECEDPATVRDIEAAQEIAQRCIEELRQLSGRVHPRLLEEFGLLAAVRNLGRMVEADGAVRVSVRHEGVEHLRGLTPGSRAVVYRVIEEAVRNSVRHAGATKVDVSIVGSDGRLLVEVTDDGAGFDTTDPRIAQPGTGLGLVREHLVFLGGECGIYSTPGGGTSICMRLPLPEAEDNFEPSTRKQGAPAEASVA